MSWFASLAVRERLSGTRHRNAGEVEEKILSRLVVGTRANGVITVAYTLLRACMHAVLLWDGQIS